MYMLLLVYLNILFVDKLMSQTQLQFLSAVTLSLNYIHCNKRALCYVYEHRRSISSKLGSWRVFVQCYELSGGNST